jgi:hypothetical protein
MAVRGGPCDESVFINYGLFPLGPDRANDESNIPLLPLPGSGVFGSRGAVAISFGPMSHTDLHNMTYAIVVDSSGCTKDSSRLLMVKTIFNLARLCIQTPSKVSCCHDVDWLAAKFVAWYWRCACAAQ